MKNKITFLDLVIPFSVAYCFMYIVYSLFFEMSEANIFIVILITLLSFFIMYGLFSFIRDFSHVLTPLTLQIKTFIKKVINIFVN